MRTKGGLLGTRKMRCHCWNTNIDRWQKTLVLTLVKTKTIVNKIYKLVFKIKRQLYQQYWWILSELGSYLFTSLSNKLISALVWSCCCLNLSCCDAKNPQWFASRLLLLYCCCCCCCCSCISLIISQYPHDPLRTFYPQQRQAWNRYSKCWLFYPKFRFFATNPFLFWTDSQKQPLCITGNRARFSSTSHYCVKKRTVCFSLFSMKNKSYI